MPTKQRLLQGKIDEYLALLKKERRAARTIQDYRRELNRMFDELESEGMEISPMSISSDEIDFLPRKRAHPLRRIQPVEAFHIRQLLGLVR